MIGSGPYTYVLNYIPSLENQSPVQSTSLSLQNGIHDVKSYQTLYRQIGSEWGWGRQSNWTENQWAEHLKSPDTQGWIMFHTSIAGGFFELRRHPDKSVEIYYFGLVKALQGQGLGRSLLKCALDAAQSMSHHGIWLKTSSTDHPAALRLYLQGGFKVMSVIQKSASMPSNQTDVSPPCS